ncbi:rod shape-determining protein MreD [Caldibacillus lycopersici]|uniref:Rod shape-determining protein MreD n=1 Tax=Perspicuibacillus lycopersici TaxID=1325689 RepID=A0AAE3IT78_9BACI|nr:rod shape-determining protein MreD [Perspicuibacillus lycopersici]MCU9614011.1 rod shape-determining protein MreD [Perspicuibacillus lycopersici]
MNKKWWIPIFAIIFFDIESIFANYFPVQLISEDWICVPRFLLSFFIFIAVYYDKKLALIYGLVFGLIMDIVFIDILGIYLFWYPAIIYGVSKLMKIIHTHLLILAFITLLAITVLEFGVYGFNFILQITDMPIEHFVNNRLFPTLLLNLVFYLLLAYPLKKYFTLIKKVKEEEEGMFQS